MPAFVIPFNIGLYFILIYAIVRIVFWIIRFSRQDRLRLQRGLFGKPIILSIKEIFLESLVHRKIWKENPRLGYMHSCFALGWFLLIVCGTVEASLFGTQAINPAYKSIFFKYFHPVAATTLFEKTYMLLMDIILAYILSGVVIAVVKRFYSRIVGMKKTTHLKPIDKVALSALWLVFPCRLFAESFTAGAYQSGSFLTGSIGSVFAAANLPCEQLAMPFWWLYSLSLFTFFVLLPLTRYMHIPTELLLIFARNCGIKTGNQDGSYLDIQLNACSSCGICVNNCQLSSVVGINDIQTAYLLKKIRNGEDVNNIIDNCLMCGRCETKCPVGIETLPIRMIQRRIAGYEHTSSSLIDRYFPQKRIAIAKHTLPMSAYEYLHKETVSKAKVVFFAGCMTHLTPGIKKSMVKILKAANVKYTFLDEDGGVCCGRPMMLSGDSQRAKEMINHNSSLIYHTEADILITSCPICYKVFSENYSLGIKVMHHTEFIHKLIMEGALRLQFTNKSVSYHSPCELGRGMGVYNEPKNILRHIAILQKHDYEDDNSLCCGGSLANTKISYEKRQAIAKDTVLKLTEQNPNYLATACPLCKKTFNSATTYTKVVDVSELVAEAIIVPKTELYTKHHKKIAADILQ